MKTKEDKYETAEELRMAYEIGDIGFLEYLFLLALLSSDD